MESWCLISAWGLRSAGRSVSLRSDVSLGGLFLGVCSREPTNSQEAAAQMLVLISQYTRGSASCGCLLVVHSEARQPIRFVNARLLVHGLGWLLIAFRMSAVCIDQPRLFEFVIKEASHLENAWVESRRQRDFSHFTPMHLHCIMQMPNSLPHRQDTESFSKYLKPLQGKPAAATFPNLGGVLEYMGARFVNV